MPRKVDWTSVEASTDGDYKKIAPGAYAAVITEMNDITNREYVQLVFDIADGEFKGYFSDSFYANKPWAHNMILSYKETALGMTKGRLQTIQECNPGFDPFAAWDGDRMDMFVGRKVGVVLRDEEYWDRNDREFKLGSPKCFKLCRLDDVTSGKYAEVKPKMLDEKGKRDALSRAGYGEGDIAMILMAPAQPAAQQQAPAGTYDGPLPF